MQNTLSNASYLGSSLSGKEIKFNYKVSGLICLLGVLIDNGKKQDQKNIEIVNFLSQVFISGLWETHHSESHKQIKYYDYCWVNQCVLYNFGSE
ncbi:Hypothetical predicted protein [Octopus vulgaris]|uniref:Uncharacterized protein n=1 Tax=Octopus vulgaris TaxID=6645 RepID=A0AA36AQV3_OCTVU|nr:Hypothetical predicted protein [Octopus vulgaris]